MANYNPSFYNFSRMLSRPMPYVDLAGPYPSYIGDPSTSSLFPSNLSSAMPMIMPCTSRFASVEPIKQEFQPQMPIKQEFQPQMPIKQEFQPQMPMKQEFQPQLRAPSRRSTMKVSDFEDIVIFKKVSQTLQQVGTEEAKTIVKSLYETMNNNTKKTATKKPAVKRQRKSTKVAALAPVSSPKKEDQGIKFYWGYEKPVRNDKCLHKGKRCLRSCQRVDSTQEDQHVELPSTSQVEDEDLTLEAALARRYNAAYHLPSPILQE